MPDQPTYNPKIHHRRSIRLKGYDYAQAGLYFITICCQERAWMFGEVITHFRGKDGSGDDKGSNDNSGDEKGGNDNSGEHVGSPVLLKKLEPKNPRRPARMQLNDAGKMIEKWYFELENKYPNIKCHEMIVMPNHFHCIIENSGADLRFCPCRDNSRVCPSPCCPNNEQTGTISTNIEGEHAGSPLHRVVQWFKTMTTNEYIRGVKNIGWKPFNRKLWQRNYYEHIIRNEQSYQTISKYIINNPSKLTEDKFYSNVGSKKKK